MGTRCTLRYPSNHRVHHGCDPKYIDRNYGEVLIIWDRLFGTYQREDEEPHYGVVTPIETYHPVKIELAGVRWLIHKMHSTPNWMDKVRCLYMPPEWAPPGRHPLRRRARSAKGLKSKRSIAPDGSTSSSSTEMPRLESINISIRQFLDVHPSQGIWIQRMLRYDIWQCGFREISHSCRG